MKKTVTDNLTVFDNTLMKKIIFLSAFLFSIEFVADEEAEKISAFEKSVNDAIAQLKLGGNKNSIEKSNEGTPNCPPERNEKWNDCLGTYTFANGDQYIGGFKDNKLHGTGLYTFANGDQYIGRFKDDIINGDGIYLFADGGEYVGEFKDGNRHGQGTYFHFTGDIYVGGFKDDKANGNGTYTFANGDEYVGEYKDNRRHGQGTYTYADGEKEVGYYMNGEYVPEICEDMGLIKGTESFGGCVLKLIDDL